VTDHAPDTGHAANADEIAHHDAATHMDAHASLSDDDHGHAEPRLGPIDWRAWLYALAGFFFGMLVVGALWLKVA
jgi:hypothetical protein